MLQYEITFLVDPVLSGEEIKATATTYIEMIQKNDVNIVHVDEMGLRQLAYTINRRTSGVYFCVEFQLATGEFIAQMELALRRDERIMRFLTVRLDKYGVKYNEDKRNGLIGKVKKKEKKKDRDSRGRDRDNRSRGSRGGSSRGGSSARKDDAADKNKSAAKESPAADATVAKKDGE